MKEEKIYEMHRSDAIEILLTKESNPLVHTNLKIGDLLEEYFPEKGRQYLVKEDNLPLQNSLTAKTF